MLREGVAHLLGVSPSKEFVEHQYRDIAEITGGAPTVKPQVDAPAARAAFERVQARALEAGLKAACAHGRFGLGAVAMERGEWEAAARDFGGYFELVEAAEAAAEGFEHPLLGAAYAHYQVLPAKASPTTLVLGALGALVLWVLWCFWCFGALALGALVLWCFGA